ncbi:MAG: tol-pal system protein YbgF [Gammaproteobacteria bacterium]|nr:tol-pal system protein YbgF [Gammaproteobacteria bacterium]
MPSLRVAWLIVFLSGSLASCNAVQAQTPDSSLTLELLQRIEQLEREVRHIRGQLELYRHQVDLLQREREAGYPAPSAIPMTAAPAPTAPIDERPAETSRPLSSHSPVVEQTPVAQPAPPVSVGAEQANFDAALHEFREGRYPQAIAGFRQFLQAHPASPLAGEAQYWLGESYYAVRDHDAAKESFISLGLRYPDSERLPDALLKLGYLYEESGDISRAKEVLQKLLEVYPDTQAADLAAQRLSLLH